MIVLLQFALVCFGVTVAVTGVVNLFNFLRNRRLVNELASMPPAPEFTSTITIETKPVSEAKFRYLQYTDVLKKFNELIELEMNCLPTANGSEPHWFSYHKVTPEYIREFSLAYNRAHDVLEKWLEGSSVVYPTGQQNCDFLHIHKKKDVPAAVLPQSNKQHTDDTDTAERVNRLVNETLEGFVERYSLKIRANLASDIENTVWKGINNHLDNKVKTIVKELLNDTLQSIVESATKEREEAIKKVEEEAKSKAADEVFYQQVLAESQAEMDRLRKEEELRRLQNEMQEAAFKKVRSRSKKATKKTSKSKN